MNKDHEFNVKINNEEQPYQRYRKYLGTTSDGTLSFKKHFKEKIGIRNNLILEGEHR